MIVNSQITASRCTNKSHEETMHLHDTKSSDPIKDPSNSDIVRKKTITHDRYQNNDGIIKRLTRGVARRLLKVVCDLLHKIIRGIPYFHFIEGTRNSQNPCLFRYWFWQKCIGLNRKAYWPVHFTSKVNQPQNILIGVDTAPGYEPGCYIQGLGPVHIGDYTQFAANVGIISANHDFTDLRQHSEKPGVAIGSYCWLGMNSVILPGVELGDFTIVGANTVVTKSFAEGYCVIAGSPAKVVRKLCPTDCKPHCLESPYHGYIRQKHFEHYRKRWLRA